MQITHLWGGNVGWFRHEIRSIYEQLRAAGVPVREMITEQQRVISW